jgi:hypothetical protein
LFISNGPSLAMIEFEQVHQISVEAYPVGQNPDCGGGGGGNDDCHCGKAIVWSCF